MEIKGLVSVGGLLVVDLFTNWLFNDPGPYAPPHIYPICFVCSGRCVVFERFVEFLNIHSHYAVALQFNIKILSFSQHHLFIHQHLIELCFPKTAFYDFLLKEERGRNVLAVKPQVETVAVIVVQRSEWHI